MQVEENLILIQQIVGEACQKVGYELVARIYEKSRGYRIEVKVFDGDLTVYHSKKIRSYIKVDHFGAVKIGKSPRPSHLIEAINRVLARQGRRLLESPAAGDESLVPWLLYG